MNPSLVRSVNVLSNAGSVNADTAGVRTERASIVALFARCWMACACGVNTIRLPARTSNGSPVAVRSRVKVRLIAEALNPKRRAAPATLASLNSASSASSKLKSGSFIVGSETDKASGAGYYCKRCTFRHLMFASIFSTSRGIREREKILCTAKLYF